MVGAVSSSSPRPRGAAVLRTSLLALAAAAFLAAFLAATGCGDDGKPKLYEECTPTLPCTEGLACLNRACTRACRFDSAASPPAVGECRLAEECMDELSGCCLLNLVDGYTGTGNCTLTPPATL